MIVLSARGLHSLDAAGLGDAVREVSIPIYGRGIHNVEGDVVFQPYGNNREALMAVDRNELNETLLLKLQNTTIFSFILSTIVSMWICRYRNSGLTMLRVNKNRIAQPGDCRRRCVF